MTDAYEQAPAALTVTKAITGPGAAQHGTILITVDCGPGHTDTLTVAAGDLAPPALDLTGIPAPATCNISEPLNGATATVTATTAGVGPLILQPGNHTTATVTNDYQPRPGRLLITKAIGGDAADQHGPIQITVTCTDTTTATFDIPAGAPSPGPFIVEPVAAGATCTIAEPANGATANVTVTTAPAVPLNTGPIPAGATVAETITNTYTPNTGRLLVAKQILGAAAASRGAITLSVACSDGTTATATYAAGDPLTAVDVGPLPFATTCTITEPATGANDAVTVDGPHFAPAATVTTDQPLQVVTVTNTYDFAPGTLELVKDIDGPAAGDRGTIRVRWTCDNDVHTYDIAPHDPSPVTLSTAAVSAGTTCIAIELNDGAAAGVDVTTSFDPPTRTITATAGQTRRLTITNTYTPIPTGELIIQPTLTGPAEPRRDTVQLTVNCDNGRTITQTITPTQAADPALIGSPPAPAAPSANHSTATPPPSSPPPPDSHPHHSRSTQQQPTPSRSPTSTPTPHPHQRPLHPPPPPRPPRRPRPPRHPQQ